jgi:hypothetical protein
LRSVDPEKFKRMVKRFSVLQRLIMTDERPYLAAALMCERVLEEKDRVLSVIRIVDNYFVQRPPKDLPKEAKPVLSLVAVLCFKKSHAEPTPIKHTVTLILHGPSGKIMKSVGQEDEVIVGSFIFEGETTAANIIVNAGLNAGEIEFGPYWFDVSVDGEQVTRIPFRLLERPEAASPTQ